MCDFGEGSLADYQTHCTKYTGCMIANSFLSSPFLLLYNNNRHSEDFHSKTDACITMYLKSLYKQDVFFRKI